MKTLLERTEALVTSAKDWYLGKEQILHREHAEIACEVVKTLDRVEDRLALLEATVIQLQQQPTKKVDTELTSFYEQPS